MTDQEAFVFYEFFSAFFALRTIWMIGQAIRPRSHSFRRAPAFNARVHER
jgi:hypothetical protein